jgi:hypothetical protein
MRLALQQAWSDFSFKCLDLPPQCGLRQKNPFRGRADVARLGHRHEATQLSQFHAGQHNPKAGSGQQFRIDRKRAKRPSCHHENDSDRTERPTADGASTEQPGKLNLTAARPTEAILFDLN